MHECLHYETDGERALCALCPFRCRIAPGRPAGECAASKRAAVGIQLRDGDIGRPRSHREEAAVPLPPESIFSVGSIGCNLTYGSPNWSISQGTPRATVPPASLSDRRGQSGNIGIAYTYNEQDLVQYVLDTARLAQIWTVNVLVTNGILRKGRCVTTALRTR